MEHKPKPKNSAGPIGARKAASLEATSNVATVYLVTYPLHAMFADSHDFLKPTVYCRFEKDKKQDSGSL
jgi:hypothetical protein